MTGWTPLMQQIVGSSVWNAPDHVRIAWITMLAVSDRSGVVPVTVGGLAVLARITRDQAADAIRVLSEPDEDTLTQKHEGRRIERVAGGWKILNWDTYREKAKAAIIREQNREAQARYRERLNAAAETSPAPTTENNNSLSAPVKEPTLEEVISAAKEAGLSQHEAEKFHAFYSSKGWMVGKNRMKSLSHAMRGWALRAAERGGRTNPDHNQMQEKITVKEIDDMFQ